MKKKAKSSARRIKGMKPVDRARQVAETFKAAHKYIGWALTTHVEAIVLLAGHEPPLASDEAIKQARNIAVTARGLWYTLGGLVDKSADLKRLLAENKEARHAE